MARSKLTYNNVKKLINQENNNLKNIVEFLNSRPGNVYKKIKKYYEEHREVFCSEEIFEKISYEYKNYSNFYYKKTNLKKRDKKKLLKKVKMLEKIICEGVLYYETGKIMKLMKYSKLSRMKDDFIKIREHNLFDLQELTKIIRHC